MLVDPEGRIALRVSGEGHVDQIDAEIKNLVDLYTRNGKLNTKRMPLDLEKQQAANNAPLSFPGKIVADKANNRLFVADSGHNRIVVIDPKSKALNVIGSGKVGASDGSLQTSSFNHPQGMAFDGHDKLYVADTENHRIRLINLKEHTVSTIAGTGERAPTGSKGGTAKTSELNSPWDVLLIGEDLYVAMSGAHQIWKIESCRRNDCSICWKRAREYSRWSVGRSKPGSAERFDHRRKTLICS